MTAVIVSMIVVLAVAVAALAVASYVRWERHLPLTPRLRDLVDRVSAALPTLRDGDLDHGRAGLSDDREAESVLPAH